ncbi:hypothetical protein TWF694_003371 [Orbilia ellipsospora]|uniref:CFEM domain-containing protein n=1 Tax=Orbilia ellipsospora TaxID=2528407 RepID=A0AAV9WY23_9PEZI
MKFTTVLATTATLSASLVSAQTGLVLPPSCAITCITQLAPSSGCDASITNYACFCKSQTFASTFASCVQKGCSAADLASTATAVQSLCGSVGVTISIPSGITTGSATVGAASSTGSVRPTATAPNSAAGNGVGMGLLGSVVMGAVLLVN